MPSQPDDTPAPTPFGAEPPSTRSRGEASTGAPGEPAAPTLEALAERIANAEARFQGTLPDRGLVARFGDETLGLLFPDGHRLPRSVEEILDAFGAIGDTLERILRPIEPGLDRPVGQFRRAFVQALPGVHRDLELDAAAIEAGDPAATSVAEVVLAYPGFAALGFHRLAHALHGLRVPLVPRILAEVAHSRTGIDIHPGASIGRSFCIDHGTGVVIGETAVIGDGVKLYQGVTLGALSVHKQAAGAKRHPTIEDRVVIYANATVLGGATTVGHDSIVGANVWLTSSVPPFSLVHQTSQVRIRRVPDGFEDSDFVI